MKISHDLLLERLTGLGWEVTHFGYENTYLRHDDGRIGSLPWARRRFNTRPYTTATWARLKRELRLTPKEIHG